MIYKQVGFNKVETNQIQVSKSASKNRKFQFSILNKINKIFNNQFVNKKYENLRNFYNL
jgi:hypothetical protein